MDQRPLIDVPMAWERARIRTLPAAVLSCLLHLGVLILMLQAQPRVPSLTEVGGAVVLVSLMEAENNNVQAPPPAAVPPARGQATGVDSSRLMTEPPLPSVHSAADEAIIAQTPALVRVRPQARKKQRLVPARLQAQAGAGQEGADAAPVEHGVATAVRPDSPASPTPTARIPSSLPTRASAPGKARLDGQDLEAIRDQIKGNLIFPLAARRMGWSGRVVVAFALNLDGEVSQLRILKSSGHAVLDDTVLAAIRRTMPFPAQPATAEVVLPITFALR
jgi:periplasmic protein TonB